MLISESFSREEILSEISKELRRYEIKVRSEKHNFENLKPKKNKKLFKTSLNHQLLENAVFSNGQCSVVPRFVLHACQKIQKESKTEGIFRKTGSVKKQNEIRDFLEKGGTLNDKHFNVIDIANLLKTYFRELPDPLIPPGTIQDSLIRCLKQFSEYEQKVESILMICMFLSPIVINTLAYFLQFLQVIIKNSSENFMTTENLVKCLTPSLMPLLNHAEQRLNSHFKIIELLIENANLIGVIPDRMMKCDEMPMVPLTEERKKKKRHSGSLNRVFHNFRRKIVGSLESSENLDKSSENTLEDINMMTPNITKLTKKRRLEKLDLSAFGSKKKKDMLKFRVMPDIDSPYVPKKAECRSSLGEKPIKSNESPKIRRHSLAPNTLNRNKKVVPLQQINDNDLNEDYINQEEYVRVPKSEYEAFKTRLNSIETKMTKEFNTAKLNAIKAELGRNENNISNGIENVENKFHEILHEVEKIEDSERKTEQLAKRLSRELKIRPHADNPIIRSPSARKIGSLRRRRENTTRLSRNQSWHLGPSTLNSKTNDSVENKTLTSSLNFYPKANLKRTRLVDSVASQDLKTLPVIVQSTEKTVPEKPVRKTVNHGNINSEIWTPATDFFNDPKNQHVLANETRIINKNQHNDMVFKTPNRPPKKFVVANEIDLNNTPMLPPKITPIRNRNTPMSDRKKSGINKTLSTPSMLENREARASIIQIRNQNAGMVAQKAKLFDNLSADLTKSADISIKIPRIIINKNLENVKNMNLENIPKKQTISVLSHSPRSPGINRRMQLRMSSSQSPALKTIKENSENRKNRINILNSDVLNEIASPKNRKHLSQSSTPRKSKTPKSSSKKYRTPKRHLSKSPRMRRHHIKFDEI